MSPVAAPAHPTPVAPGPSSRAFAARSPSDVAGGELARPGRPLDAATLLRMERAFGRDLSAVRIHDDAQAQRSARSLNARAYAGGEHVVIGPDGAGGLATAPDSVLLAHELAHVLQQRIGGSRSPGRCPRGSLEAQADTAARAVASGGPPPALTGSAIGDARWMPRASIAQLSDEQFATEHELARAWLLEHAPADPAYADTESYVAAFEAAVSARQPTMTPAPPSASGPPATSVSGGDAPPATELSPDAGGTRGSAEPAADTGVTDMAPAPSADSGAGDAAPATDATPFAHSAGFIQVAGYARDNPARRADILTALDALEPPAVPLDVVDVPLPAAMLAVRVRWSEVPALRGAVQSLTPASGSTAPAAGSSVRVEVITAAEYEAMTGQPADQLPERTLVSAPAAGLSRAAIATAPPPLPYKPNTTGVIWTGGT
jgi:hypothetical protein